MYSIEAVIVTAAIALVIGAFAGVWYSRKNYSQGAQREMEKQISELHQQQQQYQQEVAQHFTHTAELLDKLSESYREVHNHLALGAQKLAGEAVSSRLQILPEPSPREPSEEELNHITPPLDYAPKKNRNSGVLDEDFALEKIDADEDGPEKR